MKNEFGDMPVSDFRKFGYQLIDWIADYLDNIENYPVLAKTEPGEIKNNLPDHPPESVAVIYDAPSLPTVASVSCA